MSNFELSSKEVVQHLKSKCDEANETSGKVQQSNKKGRELITTKHSDKVKTQGPKFSCTLVGSRRIHHTCRTSYCSSPRSVVSVGITPALVAGVVVSTQVVGIVVVSTLLLVVVGVIVSTLLLVVVGVIVPTLLLVIVGVIVVPTLLLVVVGVIVVPSLLLVVIAILIVILVGAITAILVVVLTSVHRLSRGWCIAGGLDSGTRFGGRSGSRV